LRRKDDSFEVYYPLEFEQRDTASRQPSTVFKNTLDNNIYILNALRVGTRFFKDYLQEGKPSRAHNYYDDFSDEDIAKVEFSLDQIAVLAGNMSVYLFTIPTGADFEFARLNGYDFSLVNRLQKFADERPNVRYLDLLPDFLTYADENNLQFRDFTLGCDPHWGKLGGKVAADAVHDFVYAD
jgi:hypothetical protein